MDGGVITIKFEADVKAINDGLKEVQKTVDGIDMSHLEPATKAISAQVKKMNAETRRYEAENKRIALTFQRLGQIEAREIAKTSLEIQKNYNDQQIALEKAGQAQAFYLAKRKQDEEERKNREAEAAAATDRRLKEQHAAFADEIKLMDQLEKERNNKAKEAEITRNNQAKEAETARKNQAKEVIDIAKGASNEYIRLKQVETQRLKNIDDASRKNMESNAKSIAIMKMADIAQSKQIARNKEKEAKAERDLAKAKKDTAKVEEKSSNSSGINLKNMSLTGEKAEEFKSQLGGCLKNQIAIIGKSDTLIGKIGEIGLNTGTWQGALVWVGSKIADIRLHINMIVSGIKKIISASEKVINFWGKILNVASKIVYPVASITKYLLTQSQLGNRIKQAFSIDSMINFGKSCLTAASDLVEVQNIADVAFPKMTKEMDKWSKSAIYYFGMSEKKAKEYASTLGLMAQSSGLTEEQSYTLGTNLTAVVGDLASIYNKEFEDVYQKMRSGVIAGRTNAISQLGIGMQQANLQSYMLSKGITAAYSSLDNATKTIIRYNYVIEQTRKQQGDFIRTQGTWANQSRLFAEYINLIKINLGKLLYTALLPILTIVNKLLQYINILITKVLSFLQLLGIKIQVGTSGSNGYTDELENIGDAAEEAAGKVQELSDGPFSEMHKVNGDNSSSAIKNIFGGGSGLLGLDEYPSMAESIIKELEKKFNEFLKKFNFEDLKKEVKRTIDEIKKWIQDIKTAWQNVFDEKGTDTVQKIIDLLANAWGLVNDISEAFRLMWENGYGEKIFGKAHDVIQNITDKVDGLVTKIREAWNKPMGNGKKTQEWINTGTNYAYKDSNGNVQKNEGGYMSEHDQTVGEWIAEGWYKIHLAILDCIDDVTNFFGKIVEHMDIEGDLKNIGEDFHNIANAIRAIGQWFDDHPELAEKIAHIIDFCIQHLPEIIVLITILKGAGGLGGLLKIIAAIVLAVLNFLGWLPVILLQIPGIIANILGLCIGYLITHWDMIKSGINTYVVEPIKNKIDYLKSLFELMLKIVSLFVLNKLLEIKDKFNTTLENIKTFFGNAADWIKTNFIDKITGFFDGLIDKLGTIGSTIRTVLGYGSSLGNIVSGSTSTRDWAKESLNKNYSGRHANGGVWAPNRPQLAVLGDHPSQTEYALTEGHLDAIANRMSMAIMRGMAGANQNSKQPIIVQIGNEEFKDYVVNAVNENNFRRN